MYTINPGEFKHPIEIQTLTPGVDEDNIPCEVWSKLINKKAKIVNVSGKEVQLSDGISSFNSKRFIIRYPRNITIDTEDTTKYRIVYKKPYNITYMSNIQEANKYLEIIAEVIK